MSFQAPKMNPKRKRNKLNEVHEMVQYVRKRNHETSVSKTKQKQRDKKNSDNEENVNYIDLSVELHPDKEKPTREYSKTTTIKQHNVMISQSNEESVTNVGIGVEPHTDKENPTREQNTTKMTKKQKDKSCHDDEESVNYIDSSVELHPDEKTTTGEHNKKKTKKKQREKISGDNKESVNHVDNSVEQQPDKETATKEHNKTKTKKKKQRDKISQDNEESVNYVDNSVELHSDKENPTIEHNNTKTKKKQRDTISQDNEESVNFVYNSVELHPDKETATRAHNKTKTKKKKHRDMISQDNEESVNCVDNSVEPHPDTDNPTNEHTKTKTKKKKQRDKISQDNEESVNYVDNSVELHSDKENPTREHNKRKTTKKQSNKISGDNKESVNYADNSVELHPDNETATRKSKKKKTKKRKRDKISQDNEESVNYVDNSVEPHPNKDNPTREHTKTKTKKKKQRDKISQDNEESVNYVDNSVELHSDKENPTREHNKRKTTKKQSNKISGDNKESVNYADNSVELHPDNETATRKSKKKKTKKRKRDKISQDNEESVNYVDNSVEPHPNKDNPTREHTKTKTKKKKQRDKISQDNEESVNYVDNSVELHSDKENPTREHNKRKTTKKQSNKISGDNKESVNYADNSVELHPDNETATRKSKKKKTKKRKRDKISQDNEESVNYVDNSVEPHPNKDNPTREHTKTKTKKKKQRDKISQDNEESVNYVDNSVELHSDKENPTREHNKRKTTKKQSNKISGDNKESVNYADNSVELHPDNETATRKSKKKKTKKRKRDKISQDNEESVNYVDNSVEPHPNKDNPTREHNKTKTAKKQRNKISGDNEESVNDADNSVDLHPDNETVKKDHSKTNKRKQQREKISQDNKVSANNGDICFEAHLDENTPTKKLSKTKEKKKHRDKRGQDHEESVKNIRSIKPHLEQENPTREHSKTKKKKRVKIREYNEESVNNAKISVEPHPNKETPRELSNTRMTMKQRDEISEDKMHTSDTRGHIGKTHHHDENKKAEHREAKQKQKRVDIDNENEDRQDAQPNTDEIIFDYSELQFHDESNDGNRDFTFHIPSHEWEIIKPEVKLYGRRQLPRRRLQKKWTDVFSKHISSFHPGCVLAFMAHWVKSSGSRKSSAQFISASAKCKGENCSGQFEMNIPSEDGEIYVQCRVKGNIQHDVFEINRRNITGQDRFKMAKRIQQTTPAVVFNEILSSACPEEMELGNFSSVPNQGVLRKMVSELLKKEDMHSNIITELQILKENDELMGHPYIREIGFDPLVVLMFSEEQLKIIQHLSSAKTLDLYFDATGSVIRKVHGQKRPLLYSLVAELQNTAVSLADMLTTQHTIPRISHFLGTVKRQLSLKGHTVNVRKIETDYSFAIIQASTQVFNSVDLKHYIQRCFDIVQASKANGSTIIHLCSSHMLQDFSRMLKKKLPSLNKHARRFVLQCFATLQNATTLQSGLDIFGLLCKVCLSKQDNDDVAAQKESILKQNMGCVADSDDEQNDDNRHEELLSDPSADLSKQTIRESSPFTPLFESMRSKTLEDTNQECEVVDNDMYMPSVVDLIVSSYAPIFPLWSGIMLEKPQTRDTNSSVESWFKYVKSDIMAGERDKRPARFVMKNKSAIHARIILENFPGAKQAKTRGKKRKNDAASRIDTQEESWNKKKQKKTRNLYHKTPSHKHMTSKKTKTTNLPAVMAWGGKVGPTVLNNTCTIDNGLTIVHLFHQRKEEFRNFLALYEDCEPFTTLKTVLSLMDEENFNQAKLVWARLSTNSHTNLFGEETEFMMSHFDRQWKSRTVSKCSFDECRTNAEPMKESKTKTGISLNLDESIENMQEVVNRWLRCETPCPDRGDFGEQGSSDDTACEGVRQTRRMIKQAGPVAALRVYELCMTDRVSFDNLIASKEINIDDRTFELAGVTMYKEGHFCAIVFLDGEKYWYDALNACLTNFPKDMLTRYFPNHALYCQIA